MLNNFEYYIKTKIYFGENKEKEIGKILISYNAKKICIVIGGNHVKSSGLLDEIITQLNESKIQYLIIEGVRANPTIDFVKNNLGKLKDFKPDFLLPIGGGSVIDTAKSLAVAYFYDGDPFDFNLGKVKPINALPIGAILTISAAGSEMSTSCVIQDDTLKIKRGFNSEIIRPIFAIENPRLTLSVDKRQTMCGVVDILMHTIERYFQPSSEIEPADGFAETLMQSVIKAGKMVLKDPNNLQARSLLMLMSSFSHNGLMNLGKNFGMPVHQLEHALSGVYPNVKHAEGLSILLPSWMTYYLPYEYKKFAQLGRNVFKLKDKNDMKCAKKTIKEIINYFKLIDMPICYKDLGLENIDYNLLASIMTNNGTMVVNHSKKPMDQTVAVEIFKIAETNY